MSTDEKLTITLRDGSRTTVVLGDVRAALEATPEQHASAREALGCPICAMAAGQACVFGAFGSMDGTVPEQRADVVHTRRMRAYLGWYLPEGAQS